MKIGFIGAGNMGSALALAAAKADGSQIYVYDKDNEKAIQLANSINATILDSKKIAAECDFVFLGVKPNIIPLAVAEIKDHLGKNTVLVSMAAGVAIEKIEGFFESNPPIIRIMPNTPVSVGEGMILWCANRLVTEARANDFLVAMKAAGSFDKIDESKIDAASAISGCGPAFVYMFIEALADGAVASGLPRDKAMRYAAETLVGAAEMVKQSGKHPGQLKDDVCSPGGSTIEGVETLEAGRFRAAVSSAVINAYKKTVDLGK